MTPGEAGGTLTEAPTARVFLQCGTELRTRASALFCNGRCAQRYYPPAPGRNALASYRARRRKSGLPVGEVERVCYGDLIRRDGLDCHVCRKPIDYTLPQTHQKAMTMDHLIPITDPRCTHTAGNLALAHRDCNNLGGGRPAK